MNLHSLAKGMLAAALVFPATAAENAAPSAQQILNGARMSASLTNLEDGLSGSLRKSGAITPVKLYLKGQNIQFQFSVKEEPWRIFHLRMGDDTATLFEITGGKTLNFPPEKIVQPVAGTDVTYEDLALRFLYWPNPKLEGSEDVGGSPCYKLRVDKPRGTTGRYEVVYVWVHQKYGAFMRIRGHDKKGGLLKEFEVEDVMQVSDKVWTLKKMQVATCDPANGRRISITDVVFDEPKKSGGPKGPR